MDEKIKQLCQKKLEKEKIKLEGELQKINKRNDYGTSEEANVYEFEEREERLSFSKNLKNMLSEVDNALKKIEKNKYGICEACNERVEFGRLKVYPTARFCATCAAKPKYRAKK